MQLKSKIGFILRGLIGIKDNIIDNPKINKNIKSFSIGKTTLGDNIKCYKFGNGKENILFFGGIHGNEVGTVKLMNHWVNFLFKNQDRNNKTIYIIPCLNIDGYKKALKNPNYFSGGIIGKVNANNVDLNRNFPTSNWSAKSKLFVAGKYSEISGGIKPSSEPEIQFLLNFINKKNIKTIYVYHSCWSTVFSLNSNEKIRDYSTKTGYRIYKKYEWDNLILEQKTGHSIVWGLENDIEIIEIEMKYRWGSEWRKNKKGLISSLEL